MALPRIAAFGTHENRSIAKLAMMFVDELGKDISSG